MSIMKNIFVSFLKICENDFYCIKVSILVYFFCSYMVLFISSADAWIVCMNVFSEIEYEWNFYTCMEFIQFKNNERINGFSRINVNFSLKYFKLTFYLSVHKNVTVFTYIPIINEVVFEGIRMERQSL